MAIKINWGVSVAVFIICFVLFLAGNLIFSSMQSVDLVTEDYYAKEVDYQRQIDKQKNAARLPGKINFVKGEATLALQFPYVAGMDSAKGEIHFYRPSNKKLDRTFQLRLNDEQNQIIDIREFPKGLWKIKIDWTVADTAYYHEESIFF